MAKDDYHVIVYQILAYLYQCLKKGEKVEEKNLEHNCKYFQINKDYAALFQKACDTYLGALNILDTMEEINANTQANQLAGALALKEVIKSKQDASTAITTSNISSQSVKYATSAGSANAVAWSKVTGKPSTYAPATHQHNNEALSPAALEIFSSQPYIDFHYGNSNKDFTSRLIDFGSGGFHYYSQNGDHYFKNTSNGNQVACLKSNGMFGAGSGGSSIVGSTIYMQADWAGSGYATVYGASFTNPSSKLVKRNVENLSEEEAKKILQLTPVSFDYIKEFGGDKDQRGLIAEDVLGIIPSCVQIPDGYLEEEFDASKGIKNKVLAIDYSKLVPYLIKMVQIQQEEIDSLKSLEKQKVESDD